MLSDCAWWQSSTRSSVWQSWQYTLSSGWLPASCQLPPTGCVCKCVCMCVLVNYKQQVRCLWPLVEFYTPCNISAMANSSSLQSSIQCSVVMSYTGFPLRNQFVSGEPSIKCQLLIRFDWSRVDTDNVGASKFHRWEVEKLIKRCHPALLVRTRCNRTQWKQWRLQQQQQQQLSVTFLMFC